MSITLNTGQTQQFTASFRDIYNNPLFGVGVPQWSVSDPTVGTINSVGLFTAAASGTLTSAKSAQVIATLQGVSGSTTVTVDGSEATYLRQNIVGGDTNIGAIYSPLTGLT